MVHFDARALQFEPKLSLFHSHMATPSSAMSPPKVALPPNSTISLLGFAAPTLKAAPTPEYTRTSAAMNTMRKIKEGFIVKKASSLPRRNTKKKGSGTKGRESNCPKTSSREREKPTRARETYATRSFLTLSLGVTSVLSFRDPRKRRFPRGFRTEFVEARSISYLARLVEDATRKQFRETPGVPFQKTARETARAHFLNGTNGFTPNSSARARAILW